MNKVRATLAATGVALGVLALPAAAGAQEVVPRDVLLQWKSYDAMARGSQEDVMRALVRGRRDADSIDAAGVSRKAEPLEVKKDIEVQDAQSPLGLVVATVEEAAGLD